MNEYDVSIIIPVYNCEKYIKKCVKSIQEQDYENLNRIQVILINDGSTDSSLEICNNLKDTINDFKIDIITGENEGVSSARNKGINAAKGKYMMFIDADDFISRNAVRKLVAFFDEHYDEVDLVTYPLYEYKMNDKTKKKLERYNNFKNGTGVYDLYKKDSYVFETTVNVIVKNYYENNVLFDQNLKLSEDTKYIMDTVMKRKKMGHVECAKYYYRRHADQTVNTQNNPYYSYNDFMSFFEYCADNYKDENGNIEKYVQIIILHIIRWRLQSDMLFPYYLDGEEMKDACNRLISVIKRLDSTVIKQYKVMDKYHKIYLLNIKNNQFKIYTDHCGIYSINENNNDIVDIVKDVEIVINRLKIKKGKIKILAFLKSPILYFKTPELYIKYTDINNKEIKEKIKLKESTASLYKANIKVARFYMFEYEVNMENTRNFEFLIDIDGESIGTKYYFNTSAQIFPKIKATKVYDKKYRVQFKKDKFFITKPNKKTRIKDYIRTIKIYIKINKKINIYRLFSRKNKNYWIYNDRAGVFDNAYLQFKHDIHIKDNIKRYYILDGDIKKYKNKFDKKELKYVLKFGSLKHKLIFLNCDKLLVSFSSLQDFCPLYKNYIYYKDLLKYDLIYLQHGVLHAKLTKMYAKTFTQIDKIVISSSFEKENFINNYEYSEEDLIAVGMPRLDDDEKNKNIEPENKIIFAPSWREYLIGKSINRRRKINIEKFEKSTYYIEIIKFLQNEKLNKILKEKNLIIDFKLHPIFEPYKKCFDKIVNDNIQVSIGNTDLSKYKAFITDFSSFQFDFVNLQRPIAYFVPDMNEFKAGLHTYRELDLKYEDAFGNLCLSGDEIVDEIVRIINNGFKVEEPYKERMQSFFYKVDNRKDKLYQAIKEM